MAATEPVRKEVFIAAPPEHVFAYLTETERMLEWMGVSVELDARPGGIFRADINGRMIARGEYVEVVPHSRVVFTWGWEGSELGMGPGTTRVEITLEEQDGGTLLRLEHHDLAGEIREQHGYNWEYFLGRLRPVAEGRPIE